LEQTSGGFTFTAFGNAREREMGRNEGRKECPRLLLVATKDSGDWVQRAPDLEQEFAPAVGVALPRDDVSQLVKAEEFVVQPLGAPEANPASMFVPEVSMGFGSEA